MPPRITCPPPNFTSPPTTVKSFSTSMRISVSASRTRSPTVGPYRSAYCRLGSRRLIPSRPLEAGLRGLRVRGAPPGGVHLAVGERVEPVDLARPGQLHQDHQLLVARLEADGRPSRDIEPHPPRLPALEAERTVGLEEVEVGSDLNRTVAGGWNRQTPRPPPRVCLGVAVAEQVFPRDHRRPIGSGNGS